MATLQIVGMALSLAGFLTCMWRSLQSYAAAVPLVNKHLPADQQFKWSWVWGPGNQFRFRRACRQYARREYRNGYLWNWAAIPFGAALTFLAARLLQIGPK